MRYRKTDRRVGTVLRLAAALVAALPTPHFVQAQSPVEKPRLKIATCRFPVSGDVDEKAKLAPLNGVLIGDSRRVVFSRQSDDPIPQQ